MIVELGHMAAIAALIAALLQSSLPLVGAARGWADFMRVGDAAARVQAACVALSFAALTWAFVATDLSVALVANHSHADKPLIYKVSGVWGNHEGSMLLWVLTLALFGALVSLFGGRLPLPFRSRVLAVQGMIGVAFLAFTLLTSNPFARLADLPFEGADLNPVLQDVGLALHPPFLYLGYVGLSTSFSFAVAALLEGRVDAAWARWVRPWTLAAWVFLTIGIALGSYWAYYELGWGGWWFWDPVENASFMPWLAAAALFHSAIVVEKRGELKAWTVLLAILAFALSLLGTFLVRSGVITSVHAFASDPTRGVFVLAILGASIGGALWLFARRADALGSATLFAPISRESALLLNNLLLAVSAVAVLIGTLAPIVFDAFGRAITVGPPYFDWVFGLLMVPLMLALPVGAMLPWKRGDALAVLQRLAAAGVLAIVAFGAAAATIDAGPAGGVAWAAALGAGLALWVCLGALWDLGQKAGLGRVAPGVALRRLVGLPRAEWGKALGHFGLGLCAFGIALSGALQREDVRLIAAGDRFETAGYAFHVHGVTERQGPNFLAQAALIDLRPADAPEAAPTRLAPERRFFPVARTTTSEVALDHGFTRDIYVVLGERRPDGRYALRTYVKPWVGWIWLGALVMAAGGVASLADRRHRVGAPAPRRQAAPSAAVAAE